MTGKIFRSCFLVGLAIMVLCTALFVAVMASRYEDQVYQEMEETAVYVKRGMEESGGDYLSGLEDLEGGQRLTWMAADRPAGPPPITAALYTLSISTPHTSPIFS